MSRPSALCPVCQTRFASGTCVHVSEDGGTPLDPYVFEPIISEQSGNMVECGPSGLGAFTKQIYRDPPACCAYLTVDQPIGWDVVQGIPFNEERYDTDGMHDSEDLGQSNRITFKTPGLYLVTLNVMWNKTNDATFTGDFAAFIRLNGGKFIALDSFPVGDGDLYAAHSLSVQYPMAAGDFVDAMVKQDIVNADSEPQTMLVVAERNSPVFAATYLRSISGMTIVGVDTSDIPDEDGGGTTTLPALFAVESGNITSTNATYLTARSGSALNASTAGNVFDLGQLTGFLCLETFLSFDTSSIPDDANILSVQLSLGMNTDASVTDFTAEVRLTDWGASLTDADWIAGASLGALPLLATFSTTSYVDEAYNLFTESGTTFRESINKSGFTRMVVTSDRMRLGTQPTGNEYLTVYGDGFPALPPKLVITYST